ncbi:hypothetical protein F5Y01DRAFT_325711 [Xylaria sp. FL0043]|nr:hypothetical protein F5Y01DRAFT_325711 [Xylaria sp. FL0043]
MGDRESRPQGAAPLGPWTPGHAKVPGNEAAHKIARNAIARPQGARPQISALEASVAHVIQLGHDGRILFLDNESWVSSADLGALTTSAISYFRHFFVPPDWLSGSTSIAITVSKQEVIVARNEDLVVIKGGLDFTEKVDIDVPGT